MGEAVEEAVISVWAGTNDEVWNTQEPGSPEQAQAPETLADRLLTGRAGVWPN